MALFSHKHRGPTVPGRAIVVPASTGNIGSGEEGNVNNLSHRSKAKSATMLVALSATDGQPVTSAQQRVEAHLPNWLRVVMHDAGTSDGGWEDLPAELHVPVFYDQADRSIVAIDVDAAVAEHEPLREIGKREWKQTEAIGAPVRGAVALPGAAIRGARGLFSTWTQTLSEFREDLTSETTIDRPLSEGELEQRRRTAKQLRYLHERDPKQLARVREGALGHGPDMARGAAAGSYPPSHFEAWVEFQELSGVITADEAAALRATAAGGAVAQSAPSDDGAAGDDAPPPRTS